MLTTAVRRLFTVYESEWAFLKGHESCMNAKAAAVAVSASTPSNKFPFPVNWFCLFN